MKSGKLWGAVFCCFLSTAAFAATVQQDVSPGNLNGWSASVTGSSTVVFENGPATPPCGTGSAEFRVDSTGIDEATLTTAQYSGTLLSSLTALTYNTFVEANNSTQRAVFIRLGIDYTGDGVADDQLFFEPRLNTSQGAVTLGTWQLWNALTGNWYSSLGTGGLTEGTPGTLATYVTAQPNARIVNVDLVAGSPSAAEWANFIGNVDCFTIGVSGGDTTTFDFELDADNDGVPDDQDQCLGSDIRPNVDVNGDDEGVTTIPNTANAQGCTIQDQVNNCANGATNHGQYVSCIAHLANSLRKAGTITQAQSQEMKTGAAQSSVGKGNKGGNGHGHGKHHRG